MRIWGGILARHPEAGAVGLLVRAKQRIMRGNSLPTPKLARRWRKQLIEASSWSFSYSYCCATLDLQCATRLLAHVGIGQAPRAIEAQ